MRSPISLLILGVNAAIAASLMGIAPAEAEPGLPRFSDVKAETLPLDLATDGATDGANPSTVDSEETSESLNAQSPADNQLDRLQQQIEIRQQLNQAELRSGGSSLNDFNLLELEQAVQQQINLQNLEDLRQQPNTTPSRTLDRLQFEQRVRQQLRQQPPIPLDEKTTLAAADPDASAEANATKTADDATPQPTATDATPQSADSADEPARPDTEAETTTEKVSQSTPEAAADATPTVTETVTVPETATEASKSADARSSEAGAELTEAAETVTGAATESEPAESVTEVETAGVETAVEAAESQTSDTEPEPTQTAQSSREPAAEPETEETGEEPAATTEESRPDNETAQDEEADTPAEKPQRTTEQAEDRIERQDRDYPNNSLTPAPEYLEPDPNPLSLPTLPEEVELVGTQPITLRQAIELAIRNNPELRQARLQVEQSQAQLREAQAANFPTVDAQANFTQSGAEVVTTQAVPPTTPGGTPTTRSEVVSQDSTELGAQLQVQYPIFTSGRRSALIQAAESQVRLQQLQLEQATEQLILDATSNYYDLQQASAQVNIFAANLTQAEQSLRDAQALERAGVGTRFDVLQAEVDVANARQELTQQISQLEIARRQLAQRLNVSQSVNLEAADIVEVAGVWDLTLEESIVQAYKNRAELEQPLIQQEIAQQQRRAALAQLGPQLGFNGAFGLNNDLDQDQGFLYNYQVALTASLSLFDGGAARAQADQQESNIAIAQAQFEQTRDQVRFQVEQAYSQLDSNFSNIQTTALAVEQAGEALRLARLRFQAGVGTQTDVLRQQTALAQAQVNNLRAILDYNRALATLQRSISNYPEGFLNDQP